MTEILLSTVAFTLTGIFRNGTVCPIVTWAEGEKFQHFSTFLSKSTATKNSSGESK